MANQTYINAIASSGTPLFSLPKKNEEPSQNRDGVQILIQNSLSSFSGTNIDLSEARSSANVRDLTQLDFTRNVAFGSIETYVERQAGSVV